jgi:hypothetical protein
VSPDRTFESAWQMSEVPYPVVASQAKELKLLTKGLENVASLGIQDLSLRAGDYSVFCNRFEASFLSPRIATTLLNDPTIIEYELEVDSADCPSFEASCLSGLVSLSRNESFELTGANFGSVKCVAKLLGNRELSGSLLEFEENREELSCSNVVARLSLARFLEVSGSREIDYLASHFYEIDRDLLNSLSHEDLVEVVCCEKLQIETEDSLLNFILDLGEDYFDLLGYVRHEYVSISGIDRLLTSISLSEVDERLWLSLCSRLRLDVQPPSDVQSRTETRYRLPSTRFRLDSSRPLEGIISRLTRECGGNVHTCGIVAITATQNVYNRCHQVADYDWNDFWYSNNTGNSWIQFDFKNRRVAVTNYTIKSDGYGNCHLLQWSLDGSNDGQSWVPLDRRNTRDLDGNYVVKSYACEQQQSSPGFFRFIRLTQTGVNSANNYYLMLGNLEFSGDVADSPAS